MALPFLLGISIHSVGPHDPPRNIFVDDDFGDDANDGRDLAHAKKTIQAGIDAASDEYIDSDSDNLPDYWESKWFGNFSCDGTDDPDSDGATNIEEYRHGTDPNGSGILPGDINGDGAVSKANAVIAMKKVCGVGYCW